MKPIEYIKKLQQERGLSTYKLAIDAGLYKTTVYSAIERGNGATDETLEALAGVFGLELWELQKAAKETGE